MLDYADVSLGNVQASEHLDSAKIQLWLLNGLILH